MEKTPNFRSKFRHFKNNNQEVIPDNNAKISNSKTLETESPGYIPCTQEGLENIDVVWDWNSPQSKKKPRKSQKRLELSQSPKTTIKRHLSNNSIQGFEKIQEELRLLKEEISVPEHEECLILSPIEEAEYKNVNNSHSIQNIELENFINEADDFFDDSLNEQLLICSTQVEVNLNKVMTKTSHCDNNNTILNNHQTLNEAVEVSDNISDKTNETARIKRNNFLKDNVGIEKSLICTDKIIPDIRENKFSSTTVSISKVEFHRTQSFEMSNLENKIGLPHSKKEEIEKKRKEAIAKLEMKKKQGNLFISPTQCSLEEIERKRQEALAKREARRQQEIIERKRQEALKRLEVTRKKNAQVVKSSLTSRLN